MQKFCKQLWKIWVRLGEPMPRTARFLRYRCFGSIWPSDQPLPQANARSVAVIIPCHNYGCYLAEAIESVLHQKIPPKEIVVVDDASTDNTHEIATRYATQGVQYVQGQWYSVAAARNEGVRRTQSPLLLFLDADDRLPPHYIKRCLHVLRNPRIAIAYGNFKEFGASSRYLSMPDYDHERLMRQNYISSHAVVRRQAFDLVGGFRETGNAHQDWDLWKRILRTQWKAKRARTFVYYRRHPLSMLQQHRNTSYRYENDASLLRNPLTIFTPFAGRETLLDDYMEALRGLEFDPNLIRLHWYDSSGSEAFGEKLKAHMATLHVERMTYTRAPLPPSWFHTPESLIRNRVSDARNAQYYYEMAVVRAYSTMITSCDTEFVLTWEDDILPEPHALQRMIQAVQENTVAVVAPYRCVLQGYWMIWDEGMDKRPSFFAKRGSGIQRVGGSGFGYSLFRTNALASTPIQTQVFTKPPLWYDTLAFRHLRTQGNVLCNWDIDIGHVETQRFNREKEADCTVCV